MTRQITLLTFVLTSCLTICAQTKTETKNKEQRQNVYTLDTLVVAILPFDTTHYWVFKDSKPTELTNDDLQKIETILNKCINDYNPDQEKQFKEINEKHPEYKLDKKNFTIDLSLYKRQYVAVLNSKGEKEVWVNCFCGEWSSNDRNRILHVEDGGNCYFNLKINLTRGEFYELIVNGVA
jgi:transcriptional regulator of heat shock response